ncbi:MAG: hypothetical protein AMXMBFR19_09290 [Chthonomonadaceae bacterium]|uniref:CHAT domain-containing protein n=1 Tax=Candidatus Nitrosymbiomonas proteolyticus TaxID=2608984 RepID=A0A809RCJ3_9BACT|nr:hypothetical protein NPRO_19630 [Candidatus Nitrosymbiomonas proteolyticus]
MVAAIANTELESDVRDKLMADILKTVEPVEVWARRLFEAELSIIFEHGYYESDRPASTRLCLQKGARLYTTDVGAIAKDRLRGKTIWVFACESGKGTSTVHRGNAQQSDSSLLATFIECGATSVLSCLWKVAPINASRFLFQLLDEITVADIAQEYTVALRRCAAVESHAMAAIARVGAFVWYAQ